MTDPNRNPIPITDEPLRWITITDTLAPGFPAVDDRGMLPRVAYAADEFGIYKRVVKQEPHQFWFEGDTRWVIEYCWVPAGDLDAAGYQRSSWQVRPDVMGPVIDRELWRWCWLGDRDLCLGDW